RYRVVDDSSAVVRSLVEAYAAATCASVQVPSQGQVPLNPGRTVELPVEVPYIATDGSIAVIKSDPRVLVAYLDPDGHIVPKTGAQGDSEFEVSGEGSPVEVLRIRNPEPGRWRVRLRSDADTPQNVSAVVIWKSAVRSSVFVDPPAPAPGQVVTVTVTVETRKAAVTDPRALAFLRVGARLTGAGFAQE